MSWQPDHYSCCKARFFLPGTFCFPSPCCHFCLASFFSLCSPATFFSLFNLDFIDKDKDFNCICRNKVGSLACVRCLSDFRFENVHILQLIRSNEDVSVNSLFICLPVRKLPEKKSFTYNLSHLLGFILNVIT